jgi:acyl-CoA thioesterase YciA
VTGGQQAAPRGVATVRTMAMPRDANWLGDIFGGWLMSHADLAGAILAYRRAGGKVVTVAVNEFRFLQPVYVGDIVSCFAHVDEIGTSSLRVSIDVRAERPDREALTPLAVATACITYVRVGEDRRPQPVPK